MREFLNLKALKQTERGPSLEIAGAFTSAVALEKKTNTALYPKHKNRLVFMSETKRVLCSWPDWYECLALAPDQPHKKSQQRTQVDDILNKTAARIPPESYTTLFFTSGCRSLCSGVPREQCWPFLVALIYCFLRGVFSAS